MPSTPDVFTLGFASQGDLNAPCTGVTAGSTVTSTRSEEGAAEVDPTEGGMAGTATSRRRIFPCHDTHRDRGTRRPAGLPSRRPPVVREPVRGPDGAAGPGLGRHPLRPAHADLGSHRLGKDAGRLPGRAGRAPPGGDRRGRALRRDACRLRLAAEGAERGYPSEPVRAPKGHPGGLPGAGSGGAEDHGRRPERRHASLPRGRAGRRSARSGR